MQPNKDALKAIQEAKALANKPETFDLPGYSFNEAVRKKLTVTPYIVKNVINEGEVGFMFGDSGTMKSFVAADMVYHAAIGREWNGFRVNPEGTGILIVLAEGQAGYHKRIQALHKKHKADAPIWIVPEPIDVVRTPEKLKAWVELAEVKLGRKIGLVLMDTFSLMMGDGSESDNKDVGLTLKAVRAVLGDRAVLFIHHTGHGDKQRERGAYQIRANADKRIIVTRDEGGKGKVITIEGLKAKDELEFPPFNVSYEVIKLGVDQDGDDITSLAIVPTDMEAAPSATAGGKKTRAVEYVIEAIKLAGTNSKEVVRPYFYSIYPNATQATKRNQFRIGWNAYMKNACKAADQAIEDEGM